MAWLDVNESRDRRIQMLLSTAVNLQQLKQQRDIANQENSYKIRVLSENLLQNKATSQLGFAKLGYSPATPQSVNEMNMASNPNRGGVLSDAYGQTYAPNPQLMKARQSSGVGRFVFNEETGQLEQIPGMIVETPKQKLDRALKIKQSERDYRASEAAPMSADSAGRYEFANEALRNIPKLKSLLFSDAGEFRQDIATKLMYPWRYPKDKEVQNAKRWILGIATGRGLIQSGTVVKDNEWGRLMQQLGVDAFSAPESVMDSINEQESFFIGFKENIRPGEKRDSSGSKSGEINGVGWEVIEE